MPKMTDVELARFAAQRATATGVKSYIVQCLENCVGLSHDEIADNIAARLPALVLMHEWRPIETSPKDGTPILIAYGGGSVSQGRWASAGDDEAGWWTWHSYLGICRIDAEHVHHWMPIPSAPA